MVVVATVLDVVGGIVQAVEAAAIVAAVVVVEVCFVVATEVAAIGMAVFNVGVDVSHC